MATTILLLAYTLAPIALAADESEQAIIIPQGSAQIAAPTPGLDEKNYSSEARIAHYQQTRKNITQFIQLGDTALAAGNIDLAKTHYNNALTLDPADPITLGQLAKLNRTQHHAELLAQAEAFNKEGKTAEAEKLIRKILLENPDQPQAKTILANMGKTSRIKLDSTTLPSNVASKLVTLNFQEVNLRSVFEALSKAAGVNFMFDKDVATGQKSTIFVENTPFEHALKLLLNVHQLDKTVVNSTTLLIYPDTSEKHKQYKETVVKAFYLNNSEAKDAVNIIKSLLGAREVYLNESLNAVVVRDTPEIVQYAEKLVAMQDQAEAEVELLVEVLEVSQKNLREMGLHPPTELAMTTMGADSSIQTLADLKSVNDSRIQISPLSAVLKLRMEKGDAKILANPRIRVKNREHAKIQIGERIPVITSTLTSGNTGGFLPETVNYLDVGLKLEVDPLIFRNNDVRIKVDLEVSSLGQKSVTKIGSEVYRVGTRNASTTLRLQNGETQMLAGLISDEERKGTVGIPFLGDIPILGYLFSSKNKSKETTEIVLLITPRVIRNIALPDADLLEYGAGTAALLGDRPAPAPSPASDIEASPAPTSSTTKQPNTYAPVMRQPMGIMKF